MNVLNNTELCILEGRDLCDVNYYHNKAVERETDGALSLKYSPEYFNTVLRHSFCHLPCSIYTISLGILSQSHHFKYYESVSFECLSPALSSPLSFSLLNISLIGGRLSNS